MMIIFSLRQNCIAALHNDDPLDPPVAVLERYKGCLQVAILPSVADASLLKRMVACALAALRTSGCFGAHVRVPCGDMGARERLANVTFTPIESVESGEYVYYGRSF